MSGASYELIPVDAIVASAVGEPGQRSFFLQASGGGHLVTLLCEKEQVFLLAQALRQLGTALGWEEVAPGDVVPPPEPIEPLEPEWRVGELGIEYDQEQDLIVIVARELVDEDEPEEPAVARFGAPRALIRALADHALDVVAAGRPRCPHCGLPLPEDGAEHGCPATNGHRKR